MRLWKNIYWKRWIKARGCKLAGGIDAIGSNSRVVFEAGVELGRVRLTSRELHIGAFTYIRSGTQLINVASIGRFCSVGGDVLLGQERASHPSNWLSTHPFQHDGTGLPYDPAEPPVQVGHDVWIGHSAMIMSGVSVGTGAIVATRAMVTRDVPPYAIVAGMPAKIVRYRFEPEVIQALLDSRWWERPLVELKQLPLDKPAACLDRLAQTVASQAVYPRLLISRRGAQAITDANDEPSVH